MQTEYLVTRQEKETKARPRCMLASRVNPDHCHIRYIQNTAIHTMRIAININNAKMHNTNTNTNTDTYTNTTIHKISTHTMQITYLVAQE